MSDPATIATGARSGYYAAYDTVVRATKATEFFENIARMVLGDVTKAGDIKAANPGVSEPIPEGTRVVVPLRNEVKVQEGDSLIYDGHEIKFYTKLTYTRSSDSFSTLGFVVPNTESMRAIIKPLTFRPVTLILNGELKFSGTVVTVEPRSSTKVSQIAVSAYSIPGVLNDCTAPSSSYPLSFTGQTIKSITETLIKPFGIKLQLEASEGAPFEDVGLKTSKKILPFLIDLANQRDLLISDTVGGDLRIWRPEATGDVVAHLRGDYPPVKSITGSITGRKFYSHITGFSDPDGANDGGAKTIKAGSFSGLRPYSFEARDANAKQLLDATQAEVNRMYLNAVSYKVALSSWTYANGDAIAEGQFVKLTDPPNYLNEYIMQIRSVRFNRDVKGDTSELTVSTSAQTESLPWEE